MNLALAALKSRILCTTQHLNIVCGLCECPLKSACLPPDFCLNTSGFSGFSKLETILWAETKLHVDGVREIFGWTHNLVFIHYLAHG